MSTLNDGGPAFPVWLNEHGDAGPTGMTLRDWFAATKKLTPSQGLSVDAHGYDTEAEIRYSYADAMLAERAKKGGAM